MELNVRDLGRLLRRDARQTAPFVMAYVTGAAETANIWTARLITTGGTVRFTAPNGQTFKVDQPVLLSRPDASGLSRNTTYVFAGLPAVQAGAGAREQTVTKVAATITQKPASVALQYGIGIGGAVTFDIYGMHLDSGPVTYGTPNIGNTVDQVITATQITLTVAAQNFTTLVYAAKGRYSLTVAGILIPNFFIVA